MRGKLYDDLWETYTHGGGIRAYAVLDEAKKDFPKRTGQQVDGLTILKYYRWLEKWFGSELGENSE